MAVERITFHLMCYGLANEKTKGVLEQLRTLKKPIEICHIIQGHNKITYYDSLFYLYS